MEGNELAEVEQALPNCPPPHPGYQLTLQHQGLQQVRVDLWELCYQVCFRNQSLTRSVIQLGSPD